MPGSAAHMLVAPLYDAPHYRGSVTGLEGSRQLPDYSMTMGAIHAWTRTLAAQRVERGIPVNAVAP